MTIQQKAKAFIEFKNNGDPRCNFVLMMLSTMFGISDAECLKKIQELAK